MFKEVVRGLDFKVEPYAPIMQTSANGRLKYVRVTPYNLKWLKKNQEGEPVPEGQRIKFEPASVWLEDRWTFVRGMAGYELTQKLFYKVCAFIWTTNDIALGDDVKRHQDVVIKEVFGYSDKHQFLKYEKQATEVTTWDGKDRAWISSQCLNRMVTLIGIRGPFAGVYGRAVEQYLMEKMPDTIPEKMFE